MSRAGYCDEIDSWALIRWRGAVKSAIRGKRGQAFIKELKAALKAMPVKRLIANELKTTDGEVCALGALGVARGIETKSLDPHDYHSVAGAFNISEALAREIMYENDEYYDTTPEIRYERVLKWAEENISSCEDKPS